VLRITNHDALSQELNLAYDKAIKRFPDREDDIDDVFEAADELHMSFRVIDQCIDTMDSKLASDMGLKFMSLANRLFGISTDSKNLFTSPDTPVSWRGEPAENIVYAMEWQADYYMLVFDSFLCHDGSPDDEKFLLSLRATIRQQTAKDDNTENARSSSRWTPDAEEERRWLIQEKPVTTANAENRSTWTPEAEREARRLIEERTVTTATALQEKLSINRKVAQGLFRHITQRKKKKYRTN
jgi:hypothetical protein